MRSHQTEWRNALVADRVSANRRQQSRITMSLSCGKPVVMDAFELPRTGRKSLEMRRLPTTTQYRGIFNDICIAFIFSERELTLTFAIICYRPTVCRLSSVTLVRRTQPV